MKSWAPLRWNVTIPVPLGESAIPPRYEFCGVFATSGPEGCHPRSGLAAAAFLAVDAKAANAVSMIANTSTMESPLFIATSSSSTRSRPPGSRAYPRNDHAVLSGNARPRERSNLRPSRSPTRHGKGSLKKFVERLLRSLEGESTSHDRDRRARHLPGVRMPRLDVHRDFGAARAVDFHPLTHA